MPMFLIIDGETRIQSPWQNPPPIGAILTLENIQYRDDLPSAAVNPVPTILSHTVIRAKVTGHEWASRYYICPTPNSEGYTGDAGTLDILIYLETIKTENRAA